MHRFFCLFNVLLSLAHDCDKFMRHVIECARTWDRPTTDQHGYYTFVAAFDCRGRTATTNVRWYYTSSDMLRRGYTLLLSVRNKSWLSCDVFDFCLVGFALPVTYNALTVKMLRPTFRNSRRRRRRRPTHSNQNAKPVKPVQHNAHFATFASDLRPCVPQSASIESECTGRDLVDRVGWMRENVCSSLAPRRS